VVVQILVGLHAEEFGGDELPVLRITTAAAPALRVVGEGALGCLSKPMQCRCPYLPSRMVSAVCWMALAAVAQALKTFVNVMPGQPTRRVTRPGWTPRGCRPKPNWMSFHWTPASVNANWMASAPISIASSRTCRMDAGPRR